MKVSVITYRTTSPSLKVAFAARTLHPVALGPGLYEPVGAISPVSTDHAVALLQEKLRRMLDERWSHAGSTEVEL